MRKRKVIALLIEQFAIVAVQPRLSIAVNRYEKSRLVSDYLSDVAKRIRELTANDIY